MILEHSIFFFMNLQKILNNELFYVIWSDVIFYNIYVQEVTSNFYCYIWKKFTLWDSVYRCICSRRDVFSVFMRRSRLFLAMCTFEPLCKYAYTIHKWPCANMLTQYTSDRVEQFGISQLYHATCYNVQKVSRALDPSWYL